MLRSATAAVLCTLCFAAPASAEADADNAIKYRQQLYKVLGASITGIAMNLKQEVTFPGDVPAFADSIALTLPHIKAATEQNTAGQGSATTKAKPAIWSDWGTFEELADEAVAASAKLQEAAASGDMAAVGQATQTMGAACKACHDKFRE
ncbi:MAG: cytochrome c [Pseudomonadota bacterium]